MLNGPMEELRRDYTICQRSSHIFEEADDGALTRVIHSLLGDGGVAQTSQPLNRNNHLFIRPKPSLRRATHSNTLGRTGADDIAGFERREA